MTHMYSPFSPCHVMTCALLSIDVYHDKLAPKHDLLADWLRIYDYLPEKRIGTEVQEEFKKIGTKYAHIENSAHYPEEMKKRYSDAEKRLEQEQWSPEDFFARLYCNVHTKESIIAYRGTDLSRRGDLGADWDVIGVKWNPYDNAAIRFYKNATDFIAKNGTGDSPIYYSHFPMLTGHSLGGYLAQIVADVESHKKAVAIVFNAPGTGGLYNPNTHHTINGHNPNIYNIVVDYDRAHLHGGSQTGDIYTLHSQDHCAVELGGAENAFMNLAPSDQTTGSGIALSNQIALGHAYVSCGLFVEHSMDTLYSLLEAQPDVARSVEQKINTM